MELLRHNCQDSSGNHANTLVVYGQKSGAQKWSLVLFTVLIELQPNQPILGNQAAVNLSCGASIFSWHLGTASTGSAAYPFLVM